MLMIRENEQQWPTIGWDQELRAVAMRQSAGCLPRLRRDHQSAGNLNFEDKAGPKKIQKGHMIDAKPMRFFFLLCFVSFAVYACAAYYVTFLKSQDYSDDR